MSSAHLLKNSFEKNTQIAFNGNYSTKSLNMVLLLEKKDVLTRLSKFSSQFP